MADTTPEQNLKISERLLQVREKIRALEEKEVELTEQEQAELLKLESTLSKILKFQEKRLKTALGTKQAELELKQQYATQKADLSSISSVYDGLTKTQKTSLDTSRQIVNSVKESMLAEESKREVLTSTLTGVSELQGIQQKIAETGPENLEQQLALEASYQSQLNKLLESISVKAANGEITESEAEAMTKVLQGQEDSLKAALKYGQISASTKEVIESQINAYKTVDKTIRGVINTAKVLLSTPQAAIGALLIGAGSLANKFGEVNKELGQSFLQGLNSSTMSATALGFIFDDTAGTVRELASEFGGVEAATLGTQTNIGLMAMNMGISNKEAVGLTASFARMNGGSTDIAADMVKTTQEFAHQNGIIPAALMQDLAGATEEFALFGKDGGENILRAAGYAQKLGVNMKTLSGLADNLLDFESSISKELELGAMLGKNINLDKARQLAYQGDIEGATKATLDQLGGIESFNRMDYFQKKATADLLGVSVAELQKMADNQGKAATMGDVVNAKFSKMGEFINGGLNKYLGTGLKGLGGMVTMAGQLGTGFKSMGIDMGKIAGNIKDGAKNLLSKGWKMLTGGGDKKVTDKLTSKLTDTSSITEKTQKSTDISSKTPKKSDGGLQSLAKGLKAMGDPKVLFGALNLIPTALGFVAILPGIPGMLGVSLLGVAAGAGLISLGKGLKQLGNPKALLGSAALAAAGLGFAVMTLGLPGMLTTALLGVPAGVGLTALSKGLNQMSKALPGAAALALTGLGFMALSLGLPGMIGVSLLAVPVSFGLGIMATALTTFGTAAANPLLWLGIGAIGALGIALIPMAAALAIAAPAITAFGDVISAAFGGIATIITATSDGLTNMLGVITLEKAAAMLGLAGAFPLLAAGIGALGIATFIGGGSVIKFLNGISESGSALAGGAADAIHTTATSMMSMATALNMINTELEKLSVEKLDALADFSMNVSVGNAVSAVGESISGLVDSVAGVFGGGEGEGEDKNQLLIDEIKGLRTDLNSGKIAVYMDGEKVTSRVSAAVERVGGNSYAMS